LKRKCGIAALLFIILSAIFLVFNDRGRPITRKIVSDIPAIRHIVSGSGTNLDLAAPPADPLLVGAAAGAQPVRTHSTPIYQAGALADDWQDWSWADHILKAPVAGAEKGAISVPYAAWTGLYFHALQPVSAWAGTVNLTLNGGPTGGQQLTLVLMDESGNTGKHVPLAPYLPKGSVPAGRWISVRVPVLDSLARGVAVGGVILQEAAGKSQPIMYIRRIALNIAGPTDFPVGHTAITLRINAGAGQHQISPYIYGLAADDGAAYDRLVRPTLIRWGGNPNSRYNWKLGNAWNTASDYFYQNTNYGNTGGSSADEDIAHSKQIGAAEWLTIPTLGWVAKDTTSFSFPGADGKPTDGQGSSCTNRKETADPTRTSIQVGPAFMQEWIRHLQSNHLDVRFFAMDNEPELWGVTHYDVHPICVDYDEIYDKFITYATAVKAVAPQGLVTGPGTCCWYYYWNSMAGDSDKAMHDDKDLLPWFLAAVREHDEQIHQRTLDVLDIHYYPDGFYNNTTDAVTSAWRLLETRSLWDPTYVDHSWIGEPVQLIPRMQALIAQNYPGTRLGIGEWNFGAETSMNGALAIADVLGIFGQEDLYMAAYWRNPPSGSPGAMAFQMFRNYDGHGAAFGETSVQTSSSDRDRVAVYASLRQSDGHLVTILINKMPTTEAASSLQIAGFAVGKTSLYRYDATHPAAIQAEGQVTAGAQTSVTLPPYSITVLDSSPQ
jgi:hypothetical protein